MRRWEEKEVLIRVRLKLSSFIYKSVDSIMVHSLSHRSKHRKMLLIIVCEADISADWTDSPSETINRDQSEVAVLTFCWLAGESYCVKERQMFM